MVPTTTATTTTTPTTTPTTMPTTTMSDAGASTSVTSPGRKEPDLNAVGEARLRRIPYGTDPLQTGDLRVPPGDGPFRVVVLIHGGFWRSGFDNSLMTPLAEDATERGVATWNIDYRSVGDPGGGYPGTLEDVAQAIDHLAHLDEPLALDDVTVIGHSAGGHLALWAGSRDQLSPGDPGASPIIEPHTVVAQAAVVDLRLAAEVNLGSSAVEALLGGEPDEVSEHYRVAQPVFDDHRIIAVHGRYDQTVPISQSALIPGAVGIFSDTGTHFDVLDPRHDLWLRTMAELGLSSPN
ncbi:MAG: alpha/beta hydrolase [Actinomycetota bacterium]|nr:alpha/beta hydrolase [Actinomycetota bacterium]